MATARSTMKAVPTTVLLVEDDPEDARQIQQALANSDSGAFHVEWVRRLDLALARVRRVAVDVLLLDLILPDSQGIAVFDRIHALAPDSLILILCSASGAGVAHQAVQRGAQDYLVKGHVDAHWLTRGVH